MARLRANHPQPKRSAGCWQILRLLKEGEKLPARRGQSGFGGMAGAQHGQIDKARRGGERLTIPPKFWLKPGQNLGG